MAKAKGKEQQKRDIARNRKAFHEFDMVERFEAGIELTGTEVKSLRENNRQPTDAIEASRHAGKLSFASAHVFLEIEESSANLLDHIQHILILLSHASLP